MLDATGQAGRPANAIVDGHVVARGWLGPDQVAPLTGTEQDVREALLEYAPVGSELRGVLDRHAHDLDAVADTALAQAVHSLVRGNPDAASAAMDGITGGDAGPAALTSLRSGRGGRRVTHRVLLLLDITDAPSETGAPDGIAEPALDAWVGRVLPQEHVMYGAWVTVGGVRSWHGPYSLADAGLGPLELLGTLPDGTDATAGRLAGRLAARLAREVSAAARQPAEVEIDPDVRGGGGKMPPEGLPLRLFLPAAQALRSCLWTARPADARDVAAGDLPSTAGAEAVTARETELTSAARGAAEALRTALGPEGSTATVLAALETAARWHLDGAATTAGLRDLVTPGGDEADRAVLVAAATAVLAELDARLAVRDAVGAPAGLRPPGARRGHHPQRAGDNSWTLDVHRHGRCRRRMGRDCRHPGPGSRRGATRGASWEHLEGDLTLGTVVAAHPRADLDHSRRPVHAGSR